MLVIVLAGLAAGIVAATAAVLLVRRSTAQLRAGHAAEVAAVKAYHPARRPAGFDEHAGQALEVVAKDPPNDPTPNDPPRPATHAATCRCGRCRTSSVAGHGPDCDCEFCRPGGGDVHAESGVLDLWMQLSTDQQIALALDQMLDRPAPASLVERGTR